MTKDECNNKDKKNIIGCIADDLTGASDVCSMLIEEGAKCILYTEVPEKPLESTVDVIVVGLKLRSVAASEAVSKVSQVIKWFDLMQINKIYDKYCSTFDSSKDGNIGPILDFIMDHYNQKNIVVSPAFPQNKRTVYRGYLFADDVLLQDSSMKNHPLTPMKNSNIKTLLENQSKYKAINYFYDAKVDSFIKQGTEEKISYIIPEYFEDYHGEKIVKQFCDSKVMSGSSALIRDWYCYLNHKSKPNFISNSSYVSPNVLILSGSLSKKTQTQISNYLNKGGEAIALKEYFFTEEGRKILFEKVSKIGKSLLIYSTRNIKFNSDPNAYKKIESLLSDLAFYGIEKGIKNIIVAGGETSGAVIEKLGNISYYAEKNISTGVPILRPTGNKEQQIVLKSGNFGQDDFFFRAIEMLRGNYER